MGENKFETVIIRTAEKFSIPKELLFAICEIESSFISTAMRWEPGFYHRYIKDRVNNEDEDKRVEFEEAIGYAVSFGLMQIMGSTARWMGYKGDLTGLWQPIINLNYGCKYLAKLSKKYGNWDDAIAAYNAGSVRRKEDGDYVNQGYVDKVNKARDKYVRRPSSAEEG